MKTTLYPILSLLLCCSPLAACSSDGTSPEIDNPGVRPTTAVDTNQSKCYDDAQEVTCPSAGEFFYGQDAQYDGTQPSYLVSEDGLTVLDEATGLTWQRSADTTGDGDIDASDKLSWTQAQDYPAQLNAQAFGGYTDWRLPTIKEAYSLILFTGTDPSGVEGDDTSGLTPFLDSEAFVFEYGDTDAGERIIDAQYASDTRYVSGSDVNGGLLFGVNFADGRIKGYGMTLGGQAKTFFVACVRGAHGYGVNALVDNGDGTVTDESSGLMWAQADSGAGMNWEEALLWIETQNAANHLGYSDWRLPNVKELQALLDYTRSPDTSSSAAIDPVFESTPITNEAGQEDYPFYWSSTTHATSNGAGGFGAYVAFGRALGYMDGAWTDVHGAGAQRSDPKTGDPADFPTGHGPQGDAIRIYNYVRPVRSAGAMANDSSPAAAFAWSSASPEPGAAVKFLDLSLGKPTSWLWTFPDGTTSTGQNTVHTFATSGSYEVTLTVGNDFGETRKTQNVTVFEPFDAGQSQGGPVACSSQADCAEPDACPRGAALGCGCETTPEGDFCIPLCNTAADCPTMPDQTFTCSPTGVCMPDLP